MPTQVRAWSASSRPWAVNGIDPLEIADLHEAHLTDMFHADHEFPLETAFWEQRATLVGASLTQRASNQKLGLVRGSLCNLVAIAQAGDRERCVIMLNDGDLLDAAAIGGLATDALYR